jgi:hypothetical protein
MNVVGDARDNGSAVAVDRDVAVGMAVFVAGGARAVCV